MSKPAFAAFALLLFSTAAATAPAAELASLPKGDVTYSIKVTPRTSSETGPSLSLRQIKVMSLRNLVLYQLDWARNGRKSKVLHHVPSGIFLDQNLWTRDVVIAQRGYHSLPTLARLDKESVSWISPSNHAGETTKAGRTCDHYKQMVTIWELPDGNSPSGELVPRDVLYQAWIDVETRQPVAFDDGDALYELGEAQTFSGPLELEPVFQERLQRLQARAKPHRHL